MSQQSGLVQLSEAIRLLAECSTIQQAKKFHDLAEAARVYAQTSKLGTEAQNKAVELKLRAERHMGEMLIEVVRHQGGRPPSTGNGIYPDTVLRKPIVTLAELDISKTQSSRWQKEAQLPEEIFERYIAKTRNDGDELTSASLYRLAQKYLQRKAPPAIDIAPPSGKYNTIVIDPPWSIYKILREARPAQDILDYPTMSLNEIVALPIPDLASPDGCHVYLWTTHKHLPSALTIFEGWGVKYQCLMTWVKPTGMTPYSWMYNTEHVLFGRIGSLALLRLGLKLSFKAPVTRHSEKPDIFYQRVREASPGPRLEMFARQEREGFIVWGNEVI